MKSQKTWLIQKKAEKEEMKNTANRKQIANDKFKPNSDKPNGIRVSSLHITIKRQKSSD